TLFTATLDIGRMYTALRDANYLATLDFILYDELAPGNTSTQRISVPPGFKYLQWEVWIDVSVPWYMAGTIVYAGWPPVIDPSIPPRYEGHAVGYWPIGEFVEFTGLNLHPTENNRYHVVFRVGVISNETWSMIKAAFLDPINAYIRTRAKELSGLP
ncbi:MAG: hypothetical protein Q8O76_02710, partial [Chloroflexota bacterium]|nr:hypothetical protein [Chloroflexota bacterium]